MSIKILLSIEMCVRQWMTLISEAHNMYSAHTTVNHLSSLKRKNNIHALSRKKNTNILENYINIVNRQAKKKILKKKPTIFENLSKSQSSRRIFLLCVQFAKQKFVKRTFNPNKNRIVLPIYMCPSFTFAIIS